ncbi:TetR/AcrR family transcriptional regulator [Porphyrobacter sp. AAP82]|uniref:TetR/AcrR family transcriptional regulator n=1 Tax=Porphyrobacter sp. AAP82 TaxID=1248917 RepID=UPI001F43DCBD|nr:TetR/AcrR family transcriptional regulator [Porphyrobacter sp. AAP82]
MKPRAKKPPMSRESLLPLLAGHVLAHGLGQASLRPLAQAAGTSDRMLLYHFGTKELLIIDLLSHVAGVYAAGLDAVLAEGERPATRTALVARIIAQNAATAMQPFMLLWWEIVAGAARGLPGFLPAAEAMMGELLVWLEGHMPAGDPDPAGGARYLLTVIEGAMMLTAVGHRQTAREGLLAGGLLEA